MKTLPELFQLCNSIPYTNIGEDVSYAFLEEDKVLYIFFEPSNGKLDWKHNLMFRKVPYKGMKIPYKAHRGFVECWKTIDDIIIEKITSKDTDNNYLYNKIITIGYSHGGALSVLCHECCWFHRPDIRDNIFGISFDGPRVLASFFVKKSLKERWQNFIVIRNHNDLVTRVPPKIFGYTHVGELIKIGKSKKYGFLSCIKSHYPENIYNSLVESQIYVRM